MIQARSVRSRRSVTIRSAVRRRRRAGAVFSVELLLALPIVAACFFAIVEFSLLLSATHKVEAASRSACRVAILPSEDPAESELAVRRAAEWALGKPRLRSAYRLMCKRGRYTGDPVIVRIRVPMKAAAPDLLAMIGFGLEGRYLTAETAMRKE